MIFMGPRLEVIDVNRHNNNLIGFVNKYWSHLFGCITSLIPNGIVNEILPALQLPQFCLLPRASSNGLDYFLHGRTAGVKPLLSMS